MRSRLSPRRRVVVVGSGAAGLAAAVAAAGAGAKVTVVEAADLLGGTTATSAGGIWLPSNPWAAARGMRDSPEEALRYLGRLDLGDSDPRLASTFVTEGPRAIRALEETTALSWEPQLGWPDYHMQFEGAKRGRALDFGPLTVPGDVLARVRPDPYQRSEPTRSRGVIVPDGELVTGGRALVAALLATLIELGAEVFTGMRATGLATSGGAVVGIDARGELIAGEVVIASGGFERNPSLVRAFLRGPVTAPAGPPTNQGDGLRMGMSVGAELGNMSEAWWCPALAVPGETIDGAPFFRMLFVDLARPGGVIVDGYARRFVSEATNYNDLGRMLHAFDTERYVYPRSPSWFVFDSARRAEPLGPLSASTPDPEWMQRADTISELAERIGLAPAHLSETVARFNDHAALDADPEFRRGAYEYDHFSAGTHKLMPVTEPPFYALPILAGCLGTKGGLRTDERGRVLRAGSTDAIPGLRAAGNASANFFGGAYPGPGSTLGPALVFGWLAGEAAGSARDRAAPEAMIMNVVASPLGPELAAAARALLEDAMGLAAGEHVVITADSASDMAAVGALQSAAYMAGAQPAMVTVPRLPFQGLLADPYIPDPVAAAVANCDLWIDLAFPYMAGSTPWDSSMHNGRTRYLLAGDIGTGSLVRLYGGLAMEPLFALTAAFDQLLRDNVGHECTMTNAAGTSLRFKLGTPMEMSPTKGVRPGPFFVPGSVVIVPDEQSVTGVIELDTVFHEYYTPLQQRLTLEIDGVIEHVRGGLGECAVLERALRRASGGADLGHIIHLTCGLHPRARFTGTCFIEDQRVPGFCAVGMGRPFWVPGGGENHPDGVASLTSFAINGEDVVAAGRVVAPVGVATLAREAGL